MSIPRTDNEGIQQQPVTPSTTPQKASHAGRLFSVLTSLVTGMVGSAETAYHVTKLALHDYTFRSSADRETRTRAFVDTFYKSHLHKMSPEDSLAFITTKKESLIQEARKELLNSVKISSLKTVPFLGPSLSNYFIKTGSLEGFIKTPDFMELVAKQGLTLSQLYNGSDRSTLRSKYEIQLKNNLDEFKEFSPDDVELFESYLKDPTIETFKQIQENSQLPEVEFKSFVRIQTKDGRMHDATFLKGPGNKLDAPTIVLYHGNAATRDDCIQKAEKFLKEGYNVLSSSYAGDHVYGDDPKDNIACTEEGMRADAQADLDFLLKLGVSNISAYGISLGGSQAMNFAQAIDTHNQTATDTIEIPYLECEQTFSSAAEVIGRCIENSTNSSLLSTLGKKLSEKEFALEKQKSRDNGVDGLNNNEKLKNFSKMTFENTQFVFVGSQYDHLMGGKVNKKYDHKRNMSNDLTKTARERFKNVSQIMLEKSTVIGWKLGDRKEVESAVTTIKGILRDKKLEDKEETDAEHLKKLASDLTTLQKFLKSKQPLNKDIVDICSEYVEEPVHISNAEHCTDSTNDDVTASIIDEDGDKIKTMSSPLLFDAIKKSI